MTAPEEDSLRRVQNLQRELTNVRKHAARATKNVYARMADDLRAAKQEAEIARARADLAEGKVAAMRASRRWRVGQALQRLSATVRRAPWSRGARR
jgi:hypothetical protein